MKHFKTNSDIGSVLIGNEDWTFAVHNIGGDGTTDVYIFDSDEYRETKMINGMKKNNDNFKYVSSAQGKFGIYSYDCAFSNKENLKNPIEIIEGRYGIYSGEWCVVFVKWE